MEEVPLPEIAPVKNIKIKPKLQHNVHGFVRRKIGRTLPLYVKGVMRPTPDLSDPAGKVYSTLKRWGTKTPPVDDKIRVAFSNFVRAFVRENFEPLTDDKVDYYKWLESTPYAAYRKKELYNLWVAEGMNPLHFEAWYISVSAFIKYESYNEIKAPRTINARNDWFKNRCGPFFAAVGEEMFGKEWFIKTLPVLERPGDLEENFSNLMGVLLNNDATSYEAHFVASMMNDCEMIFYEYMAGGSPRLLSMVDEIRDVLTGINIVKFKDIEVEVKGTRMSGEMNTSLGNGFSTLMMVMFLAYLKNVVVTTRAEGDDNATLWPSGYGPTVEEFRRMGWLMKVEVIDVIGNASFCGNVYDPIDMVVVTDPRPQLADFGFVGPRYANASRTTLLQLLRAKGLSLAHQYNGVPILGALGQHVVKITRNITVKQSILNVLDSYKREIYMKHIKDPVPVYKEPGMATRRLVERLYNISITEQLEFERGIQALTLDCNFTVNFEMPTLWNEMYDRYTVPSGADFVYDGPQHRDRLIEKFLKFPMASAFVSKYYLAS